MNEYNGSNALATHLTVKQWASEIKKAHRRNQLEKHLLSAIDRVRSETDLPRAERYLSDLLLSAGVGMVEGGALESIKAISTDQVGAFAERFANPNSTWGLSSGFKKIDNILGGFENGSVYVIAARPSVGKTALMLALSDKIASRGEPVAIFSLEMSKRQLLTRLNCIRGGFNSYTVRQGLMNGKPWSLEMQARFFECYDKTSTLPIWIDDTGGITTNETRTRVASFLREHQAKILMFDYINLAGNRGENRNIEVGSVVRGLKEIAKEFHIPVVALAQLSRKVESRDSKEPELSDLRDSGELEQVAQVVIFLHRNDYNNRNNPGYKPDGKCKVLVAKNQNGAIGYAEMKFDENLTRFED
jgi:replicative DNA helicase